MDLHPLTVHFPVALLLTGALCDAAGILFRRDLFLKLGYLLLLLGALGAIAAALTGDTAAEVARKIPGIREDLDLHDDLATAAVWLSVTLALFRTHLTFKKRFTGAFRLAYLFTALAAAALTAASGYTGGRLVYEYGAGTAPVVRTLDAGGGAEGHKIKNER